MNRRVFISVTSLGLGALALRATAQEAPIQECGVPMDLEEGTENSEGLKRAAGVAAEVTAMGAAVEAGFGISALAASVTVASGGTALLVGGALAVGGALLMAGLAAVDQSIADDPPRANYKVNADVFPLDASMLAIYANLNAAGQSHFDAIAKEIALRAALLDVLELGQGATAAADNEWMILHGARALEISALLENNAPKVGAAVLWLPAANKYFLPVEHEDLLLPDYVDSTTQASLDASAAEFRAWADPVLQPGGRSFDTKLLLPSESGHAGLTMKQALQEFRDTMDVLAVELQSPSRWQFACQAV